ncbi:MAG: hypothetical protein GF411_17945 [Candidatus Lokiarchaeota archaeon]|nr:hypothetical protein [Candidatus Lokiarchaeota archaeon]
MMDVRGRFNTALKDTVEEWKKKDTVKGVYVHGSYVKGIISPNSDLDLCVIMEADEAPAQLLAKYKGVMIDMTFFTPEDVQDVVEGNTHDMVKIASVVGQLRNAEVLYDKEGKLKSWQKDVSTYQWPKESIQTAKTEAIEALQSASAFAAEEDIISAVYEIREGLFELGRAVLMKNNNFCVIKPAEILTEIRMMDPMTYQLFLRTFKLKGLGENELLDMLEDIKAWIKKAEELFDAESSDIAATIILSDAQRSTFSAINLTLNGDYELAVFELRLAIRKLGQALLAISGETTFNARTFISDIKEHEPNFYNNILVKYGAYEFHPKGVKRSIGEAEFIAKRI